MKEYLVYIVEDETKIADFINKYLVKEGYKVRVFHRGDEAFTEIEKKPPDLILLDIMLPGMDGLEILKNSRKSSYIPTILLTSRSDETDKIVGLEMGADDYITKPFSPRELTARIRSVLRRVEEIRKSVSSGNILSRGNLKLDLDKRELLIDEKNILLTTTEFALLKLFISRPGKVFTRDELLNIIWGEDFLGESRTVDVHIKNLRKKLKDNGFPPHLIRSVWGVGYSLE